MYGRVRRFAGRHAPPIVRRAWRRLRSGSPRRPQPEVGAARDPVADAARAAERGAWPEAVELWRRADDACPQGLSGDRLAAAAEAAFRAGDDTWTEALLGRMVPESASRHRIEGLLAAFRGDDDLAAASIDRAMELDGGAPVTTSEAVRLRFSTSPPDEARRFAVESLARCPRSLAVLWAVCKECRTPGYFAEVRAIWEGQLSGDKSFQHGVRPIAKAAVNAGSTDTAIDLYCRAILLHLAGTASIRRPKEKRLDPSSAWRAIEDLQEALEAAGVEFFFAAGTALGLIREGRPLSFDKDIDVGILESGWDRSALDDLFARHPRFRLATGHGLNERKVYLEHRSGPVLDVFEFYREGGRLWHDGVFVRWFNAPLSIAQHPLDRLVVPVPEDIERYLTESYGDWRVPDPSFDAVAETCPNVEVTDRERMDLYYVERAYRRLAHDNAGDTIADLPEMAGGIRRTENGRRLLDELSSHGLRADR